ncbi:KilA-N domain-containing protein [Kingella sp. (in: b-proteobacteria)]|uniref:KilA-N domain-containing protein n=1 Tax=Kingella sp. (in: b-proteobacteria) TaxID=2020713 RepID=UPI0026DBC964|nr:KilA-N domain-containing protein [Kingella sp. (in: b-proteobacteria)]MDO4658481.1 KilA-N domain-containing protein [Kingella sp. (in: b-proteobacteria)]
MNIQISNVAIRQTSNNLYNLNDLHKAAGGDDKHRPTFWLRLQQTQELIAEIEAQGGKAAEVINGGKNRGTFVCKELVYAYATWISAKFFLLVIRTFDAVVSGSLQPKPTKALPNGLTADQIETVKKLHNALVKSAPKEQQAKIAITLWSAVKSKFGVSYKEVPAEQFAEVLSVMSRVAVDNGVLFGEVLDKQPENAEITFSQSELRELATVTYYCAWACDLLRELAAPLSALGYERASTVRTLPMESHSFLRRTHKALLREMPKISSAFERECMQNSLSRCEFLI